jgi:DNA replication regulator SLD3
MRDLVRFLDSLILPTNVLDKKYKDGVPGVLESMVIGGGSLDEAENGISKSRRRRSKVMKPDTKGLYPTEDIFLRRWWGALDIESESGALIGSREDIMKKQSAQLRIRETQLQIIVILETLALQPLAKSQIDHSNELPRTGSKDDGKTIGRSKSKKSRDLVAILDIHVDRLCIWQSVAAEEETAPGLVKELRDASESSGLTKDLQDTYDVREFCNGVIVPL